MEKRKRKTGILGGTFNPIHMGHLLLAEWAKDTMSLDRIILIPAGNPYMKKDKVLDAGIRLKMVEIAVCDRNDFEISDMEIKREGYTYTWETLEELHRMYPEDELYFIIGADCLFTIEKWREPEKIFHSCHLLAAARNGASDEEMEKKVSELKRKYNSEISLLKFPEIQISSTDIRNKVAAGNSCRYMLPDSVYEFIKDNKLYL